MKKNFRWISIQLICVSLFFLFNINRSFSQQLWGMTSDGGSKKAGGNIFSINADGSGFTERFSFLKDVGNVRSERLLDYGDGFLYCAGNNILYRINPDGSSYEPIYAFQQVEDYISYTRLMKGNDGYLYGATDRGGNHDKGVIYKITKNGKGYQVLHHFNGANGESPKNLNQFNSDFIYGTTAEGGANGKGLVYKIDPDGSNFQVLHSFNGTNGSNPSGGVVMLTVNEVTYLYGVTENGGTNDIGVIYRISPNGNNFSRQYNFSLSSGASPQGPLIKDGNVLYGATRSGGIGHGGAVFSYDADADSYQKLHEFFYSDFGPIEYYPTGPLLNYNGVLYGTTEYGGSLGLGVIYRLDNDGSGFQVIHEFDDYNGDDGRLTEFNNQIYGITAGETFITASDGTIYRLNPDGSGFQTLHSFIKPNGYSPSGSLIKAMDGSLYGLTTYGGNGPSYGIAFRIQPDGTNFTILHSIGVYGSEGRPFGSLVQASNGGLYGMYNIQATSSPGNVFKLTTVPPVTYTTYDIFCWGPDCPMYPVASLMQASDGNLYGMTPKTGAYAEDGNIFRISTNGTNYTLLKKFNGTNGADPAGSLIQAPDGYLYGMTENGGLNGFGVIFKIRMDGTGFQKIFEFGENFNAAYGAHPKGSLLLGSDGKLYGMTRVGGSGLGGTVFRIGTGGGAFSVLHNFNGTNGAFPVGSLVEDVNTGFLFGMTEEGGTHNLGTIFKIKKNGTSFQKLLDFNSNNGKHPKGDLLIVVPGTPPPQPNPLSPAIEKNQLDNSLLIDVSPNPAKNSVVIRFQKQVSGKINYTLRDIHGKKLLQQSFQQSEGTITKTIDISRMPPGTYILELTTPTQKVTRKIIKQ